MDTRPYSIRDDTILYKLRKAIEQQCKLVGIHLNFAPVVEVKTLLSP